MVSISVGATRVVELSGPSEDDLPFAHTLNKVHTLRLLQSPKGTVPPRHGINAFVVVFVTEIGHKQVPSVNWHAFTLPDILNGQ